MATGHKSQRFHHVVSAREESMVTDPYLKLIVCGAVKRFDEIWRVIAAFFTALSSIPEWVI